MLVDFNYQTALIKHRILSNSFTPRPIMLVNSVSQNGVINTAPFSFVGLVSADPAIFSLCLTKKSSGENKDTLNNAIQTKKITINMPTLEMLNIIDNASKELDSKTSEASYFGFGLEVLDSSYPPILRGVKVAYFCDFKEVLEFSSYNSTLLVQVNSCFIDESIYSEDLRFLPSHIGRAGQFYLESKIINK